MPFPSDWYAVDATECYGCDVIVSALKWWLENQGEDNRETVA